MTESDARKAISLYAVMDRDFLRCSRTNDQGATLSRTESNRGA